jgi:competence protein ComEC
VSRARGLAAWPRATFGRWRTALERRLEARLSPAAREVVWPLVLGDRSDMRVGLGAELRVSGLMHLIALSGLHVSWLAQLARTFAAALGAGRRGRALVGATCALGYLGLVGPVPSLARAAMSELLVSCAELASRRVDPLQSLAWSAAVLLAVSPGWIDDFGFQLSCSATLGLVTVGSIPLDSRWAWGGVLPTTFGTLGAQAISLPLVLGSFHLLPWVAPVSNLVAVPVAGWLLSAAWLALIVDVIVPGLGAWWFRACDVLAAALESIVVRAASIPGAALAVGHDPAVLACAAAGAGLLATACARRRPPAAEPEPLPPPPASSAAIVGATLCACALVLAAWPAERRPAPGRVWLVALDVGQGDAIALGFPDGWWLVDAGPRAPRFDAGEQIVLPFLRWAGVRRLEGLAITHDDSDHCGGVPAVQRGIAIDRLIVPATLAGTPAPLARFHGVPVHARALLHATPPLVVAWPPASPSAFAPAAGVTSDNAMGLVLESGSGRGRALLTADVDSTVEARLDVRGPIGALKVGHHGSATSSGATFLARVRPAFAIVSCGRHNRFGHPDPRTLARLRAVGAAIERTDTSGARWYELDAHGVCRVEWQHPAPAAQTESAPAWPPCAVRPAARP